MCANVSLREAQRDHLTGFDTAEYLAPDILLRLLTGRSL
jgi:hypothetical protein